MRIQSGFYLTLLSIALPVALAAQTPDFSGTWQSDSNAAQKWVLDQKDGHIHVQEMNGDRVEADFTCALNGQECAAKENGRSEKIMMYFNGDKLVEIRERNAVSSKQRLTVSGDGKTLTVETVPLSSDQKAETTSFRRQST
jgi:predicted ATP-binding protein involved in virulence